MKIRNAIALACAGVGIGGWSSTAGADAVLDWSAIAQTCIQAPAPVGNRNGPSGLLDAAIIHIAMHDAIQAIEGDFASYAYDNDALQGVGSPEAAAAAAVYGMLAGLYGADDPCLAGVADPADTYAGDPGLQAGDEAAEAVLPLHRPAFALPTDPFIGGTEPGEWRPTPGVAAGTLTWFAETAPFVLNSVDQFRPKPPPGLGTEIYAKDYQEVKDYGSLNGSLRSPEQDDLALFWTTNPFNAWAATVRAIADEHLDNPGDQARLLALVSLTAADTALSVFETKYHFNFWRPITAIQEGDDDGNDATDGDSEWVSYIPSPSYPDYSSGANGLATAHTHAMALFFGTNRFDFSISSTVAGVTTNPRVYKSFSKAAEDVVDVRVFHGIHFRFADRASRRQAKKVAAWVFENALQPLP